MNALVGVRANPMGTRTLRNVRTREVSAVPATAQSASTAAAGPSPAKSQTAVTATSAASAAKAPDAATTASATRQVTKELDRDAFLQLLVFQMQNQDPLSPTDNAQMIAQLAQFSSLEQMTNLNDAFAALKGDIDQLNFISANQMIGRTISGTDASGAVLDGKVERVYMDKTSGVYLVVDGKPVSLANVQRVE